MDFLDNKQHLIITNNQQKLKVDIITADIVRIYTGSDVKKSAAIEGNKKIDVDYKVFEKDDQLEIKTNRLKLLVKPDLRFDLYDYDGNPLIKNYHGELKPLDRGLTPEQRKLAEAEGHLISADSSAGSIMFVNELAEDEQFYGLGDKTGFLNKRGYEYDDWNTDNPKPQVESFTKLYKSIPFLIGVKNSHPYGIFVDNTFKAHWDLGKESNDYYYYSSEKAELDVYLIVGDTIKNIVSNYTYLTGRTPLPQKWTLGYQQSRWGYSATQAEVERIAGLLRKHKLPCDVIHLDIDYMDGFRVFTWRNDSYTDPHDFVKKLNKMGLHVVTIIDPGVKLDKNYGIYQEGLEKGYFVENSDGTIYVNEVWPGDSVFPDFGREEVRSWWSKNIKFLVNLGVSGIWDDMNEPASFRGEIPDNIVFHNEEIPTTHAQMHNVYGHYMDKATYEGLKKLTNKRPYVITRAAYAGTQKYSTVWTGDNQSLWPHLQMMVPQLCNLGLSGFSFAGTDIGGFGADCTAELLVRWIEGAIFSPLLRNHAAMGTRSQEPWTYPTPTLSIYRKYLKLRYKFISYLYDLFYQESKTGLPIMRPLILNYPADQKVSNMNDQFMVGDQILVSPVLQAGVTAKMVYLPQGKWHDYWTGDVYDGNQYIVKDAPLDVLPIFVKDNTLLPVDHYENYVDCQKYDQITFKLYGTQAKYDHYQDNGLDFDYQLGKYNVYHVYADENAAEVTLIHSGYDRHYQKIIVELNGKKLKFAYKSDGDKYEIEK